MDEELAALHWAIRHLPPDERVRKAGKAHRDLWQRLKSDPFRSLTRDEKRLDRHYQTVHDSYVAEAVAAYRNR